jgi:hypothetical protein
MNMTDRDALVEEWTTLQNNHERYEHSTLLIKLAAIVAFAIGILRPHVSTLQPRAFFWIMCAVLCALWLQEAILRTSQARLATRLLRIESLYRVGGGGDSQALQLHSEWLASRAGTIGLLGEYARNALRPTVAFPYVLLVVSLVLLALLSSHP